MDSAGRMRELELRARASPMPVNVSPSSSFDVGKNIPLVPVVNELEVETYFKRTAVVLGWPQDVWALLLQVGTAQKACASLSTSDNLCCVMKNLQESSKCMK